MIISDKGKKILEQHNFRESTTSNVGDRLGLPTRDRQITFFGIDGELSIAFYSVTDLTEEDPHDLNIPKGLNDIKKEIIIEEKDL